MGWRTNAANQNLNRDYAKADTAELRAVLGVLNEYPVDLYLDLHVTDGADYQYDITYGYNGEHAWSPAIARFLDRTLKPRLDAALTRMGHIPGPLVFAVDPTDMSQGIWDWVASPRFSNGYGDVRHLPTILVENHSLKPFRQRVLGTYVLLAETMRILADESTSLREAVAEDIDRRADPMPLSFQPSSTSSTRMIEFLGIRSRMIESAVTGGEVVEWLGEPVTLRVPQVVASTPGATAKRPTAYWVPATWTDVIERLAVHGVEMAIVAAPTTVEVSMYRIVDPSLADVAFEGRVRVSADVRVEQRTETFPPGSARIPTDQPLGDLAIVLLEPRSEDSFFQWGFFLSALQRTEYVEPYAMEPMARAMLAADPLLQEEFESALEEDEELASDPQRRLDWFYRRTPFYDDRFLLYPVAREE